MKITVIGGGSTYTPELVYGFLERVSSLPITELWLMDIDKERLDIVCGFAQRMVKAKGNPFKVVLSMNQREAIAGASYVTTQLRVGMMTARRGDEYLGLRHGLIGQETTGVGGMAKALRTIPVILGIAKDIREVAPNALLANFTNPAGLVTEALNRYAPDVPAVGVCNVGITTKMEIIEGLEKFTGTKIDSEHAALKTLGLNHLTWHYGFTVDGDGIHPLPADPLPASCFGLISQVKMYELLTVEAAVHGDRNAMYQALLTNPLGPSADKIQAVMDDMLETNKQWLPQFFGEA